MEIIASREKKVNRFFAASLMVSALVGCVEGQRSFLILQNQVPGADCVTPAEENGVSNSAGTLDVGPGIGYRLFPIVRSNLPATTAVDNQPERNIIFLRRAKVVVDLSNVPSNIQFTELLGDTTNNTFTTTDLDKSSPSRFVVNRSLQGTDVLSISYLQNTSGSLVPSQVRGLQFDVIPDKLAEIIGRQMKPNDSAFALNLSLQMVGTHNDSEIESSEFFYTVEVCNGCLASLANTCPVGDDLGKVLAYDNVCGRPQDKPVFCCRANGEASRYKCYVGAGTSS